ncbi:PEBP-like protein [Mycena galericulata]|nr:PEBP-like protein [Mycena galericulata]
MYLSHLTSLLTLVLVAVAQDVSIREVDKAFFAANLPANLDIVFKPTALLEVSLPQAAGPPITLHAGIQVPRNDTAGPPAFHVVGDVGRGPFVDPTAAQIRHFLGGNFFNDGGRLVNTTPAISNFLQPTPPAGSDPHRYTFLLFRQSSAFATQTLVNSTISIANFNISQFANAADLGNPIAGTFMRVGPEPDA